MNLCADLLLPLNGAGPECPGWLLTAQLSLCNERGNTTVPCVPLTLVTAVTNELRCPVTGCGRPRDLNLTGWEGLLPRVSSTPLPSLLLLGPCALLPAPPAGPPRDPPLPRALLVLRPLASLLAVLPGPLPRSLAVCPPACDPTLRLCTRCFPCALPPRRPALASPRLPPSTLVLGPCALVCPPAVPRLLCPPPRSTLRSGLFSVPLLLRVLASLLRSSPGLVLLRPLPLDLKLAPESVFGENRRFTGLMMNKISVVFRFMTLLMSLMRIPPISGPPKKIRDRPASNAGRRSSGFVLFANKKWNCQVMTKLTRKGLCISETLITPNFRWLVPPSAKKNPWATKLGENMPQPKMVPWLLNEPLFGPKLWPKTMTMTCVTAPRMVCLMLSRKLGFAPNALTTRLVDSWPPFLAVLPLLGLPGKPGGGRLCPTAPGTEFDLWPAGLRNILTALSRCVLKLWLKPSPRIFSLTELRLTASVNSVNASKRTMRLGARKMGSLTTLPAREVCVMVRLHLCALLSALGSNADDTNKPLNGSGI